MYIVTKGSDDGTFEKGDHISFSPDGTVNSFNIGDFLGHPVGGWLEVEEVQDGIHGVEITLDRVRLDKKLDHAKRLVAALENVTKGLSNDETTLTISSRGDEPANA